MLRRLRAPSPALVISLIALFVALGGTSLAATKVLATKHKDAKADTKLVKKLAPSLSVKHAGTANSAANATHATSADSATNATNAANAADLGGLAPSAFQHAKKWVLVNADGSIAQQSGGITVQTESPGWYFIDWGTSIVGTTVSAMLVWPDVGEFNTNGCGQVTGPVNCDLSNNTDSWFVGTYDTSGNRANMKFYATLNG